MRIKIEFEYDGSEFCGYQKQNNGKSVQSVLEYALSCVLLEPISIIASGRTDSKVHAFRQCAHFDMQSKIPPEKICHIVNQVLPSSIKVHTSTIISDDFHARFSAKSKTYLYRMYRGEFLSPTRLHTHTLVPANIDIEKMRKNIPCLIGKHDFISFMASSSNVKDTVREIYKCSLFEMFEDELHFKITGSGFLYNMIRIIVGTLIDIGMGKPIVMQQVLNAKDRSCAGTTAKPEGLMLLSVEYL